MPYLNLELDYWTHRKTVRLVGLLGAGAEMLPLKLWTYVAKHHPETGRLQGYIAEELESAAGWTGAKGKMVDAMLLVGFLENIGDGFKIHGWMDHAGHLAAFKKRAKSAAKRRWKNYATSIRKPKITNAPNLSVPIEESKKKPPAVDNFKDPDPNKKSELKAVFELALKIADGDLARGRDLKNWIGKTIREGIVSKEPEERTRKIIFSTLHAIQDRALESSVFWPYLTGIYKKIRTGVIQDESAKYKGEPVALGKLLDQVLERRKSG